MSLFLTLLLFLPILNFTPITRLNIMTWDLESDTIAMKRCFWLAATTRAVKNIFDWIKYVWSTKFYNRWWNIIRSSNWRSSLKTGVLKSFWNLTRKHLCFFPVKFSKFSGTPTLKNICERLLLYHQIYQNLRFY